jgi:Recombinase
VRTPLFDAVYFLDTDCIARDVAYQTIILGELLKHGKQIIIKGRDYVNNPENKFTVTVLGSVAELERASAAGHHLALPRGAPPANPPRALPQWDRGQIKAMLKNETYAGTRYFNRFTAATEASREGKSVIRGRWVYRDRAEWIPVKVPAIVPRELFETVHERLRLHEERYCRPVTHYLLQGLVQCGVCGS